MAVSSRDQHANEHMLRVTSNPAGMIRISDDAMTRVLTPIATAALVMALVHALRRHVPPAGTLTGGM